MNKTVAIIALNLLVAGALSARAGYMILSGCDIGGTCRGTSDLLTWGLAIVPALVLLVVLGLSLPKLMAGLSVRREEKKQMKAEQAEDAASGAAETSQSQNRLARVKRAVAEDLEAAEAAADMEAASTDAHMDGYDAARMDMADEQQPDDFVPSEHYDSAFARNNADLAPFDAGDAQPVDWPSSDIDMPAPADPVASIQAFDGLGLDGADDAAASDREAIEREWQAVEAEIDPALHGYMAEPRGDGESLQDMPPAYSMAPAPLSELPAYQSIADDLGQHDFRLTPLTFDAPDAEWDEDLDGESDSGFASLADMGEPSAPTLDRDPVFTHFDPAEAAAADEAHGWHIEPAESRQDETLPVPDWAVNDHDAAAPRGSDAQRTVDIWANPAFDIDGAEHNSLQAPEAADQTAPVAMQPVSDELPEIEMPGIGRAPDEWNWLFADGMPLLRTSKATGFPWIAGGIGEVATAIQSTVDLRGIANFEAESGAWRQIAGSMAYAEPLAVEDAQAFVEWCNALSVDLAASNQQDALCQAIVQAMAALRGRARNDMDTSLALPDAFANIDSHGFGRSLSA